MLEQYVFKSFSYVWFYQASMVDSESLFKIVTVFNMCKAYSYPKLLLVSMCPQLMVFQYNIKFPFPDILKRENITDKGISENDRLILSMVMVTLGVE